MIKKEKVKKKVLVAMSGGVDSSVAVYLLQKKGFEVLGVFMRLGVDQGDAESSARRVAQKLDIPFYPYNVGPSFKREVIGYFLDEYAKGRTPNPCVNCNRLIKFGELFKLAKELGCDYLATGHYVKKQESKKARKQILYKLLKARDGNKDQSYFLYNLTQEQLAKILFPLGDYTKTEIKKIAVKAGLPNQKTESQDICFLSGDHNDFLKEKMNLKPGKIVVLNPNLSPKSSRERGEDAREEVVIGEHKGLPLYTIGQRRGVEIGGNGPYYVLRADYQKNILYVTKDHDDPMLYRDQFEIKKINWLAGEVKKWPFSCETVIRYRHKPIKCVISRKQAGNYLIILKKPERAITLGQSAVFYKGNVVIGGGVIDKY